MRSFSKNVIKIVASMLCVVLFLYGLNEAGKFLYESAKDNIILASADLEEHEGTIETVLLGTSLMHRGVDAVTFGEELDSVSFNLASPAQPVSGSYYILKDAIKRNPVKRVFFGVGVNSFVTDSGDRSTTAKVKALKLIPSFSGKAGFLAAVAQPKEMETLIFCPARVKNTLDFKLMKKNVKYKTSERFKNRVSYPTADFQYYGMGTEGKEKEFSGKYRRNPTPDNIWGREKIVEKNLSYIKKIAQLCQKNDVEFGIVVFPHAKALPPKQGDLSDMDAFLEDFAEEIGAELYNYNVTAKPDIYETLPDNFYMDVKHLNHNGSIAMAHMLARDYKAR